MSKQKPEEQIDNLFSSISLKSLVSGMKMYKNTFISILKERQNFAALYIVPSPEKGMRHSLSMFLYGLAITFVMYLPLILKHELSLDKLYFLLQYIYSCFVVILIAHVSSIIFRGKGKISSTASVFLYWWGFIMPTVLLTLYPFYVLFPAEDFVDIYSHEEQIFIPVWLIAWCLFASMLIFIPAFFIVLRWMSDIHKISRPRILLSMILISFPLMAIHNLFVAPYTSKGLQILSEFLSEIV